MSIDGMPDQQIADQLYLDSGERLLWTGYPVQGIRLRASDGFLVPFSVMWGGFAIFWEVMAFREGAPFFVRLWGVPFVAVGLYLIVGRFFWDAYCRGRTVYALTDRRIIIVDGGFSRSSRTVNLKTLPELSLTERRDGTGDIALGASVGVSGRWPSREVQPPALELLPNVRKVFDLIRQAQRNAA
jgi:hypothetical protein